MGDEVSGHVSVDVTYKGGEGAGEEAAKKPSQEKKPDQQMSGMMKILSGIGKSMKKVNPVFDMSNIVVYLLRKSAVIMAVIDPFLDILGAVIDTILKAVLPLVVPILKIIAGALPAIEVAATVIQGFLEPISKALEWLAKIVQEGAAIIKKWFGGGGKQAALNVGKKVWEMTPLGGGIKAVSGLIHGKMPWEKKQSGIGYIPGNMVAELHKGESVLTARETQQRKMGGGINIQNPQWNLTAGGTTTMDAKAFAQVLYKEFNRKLTDESRRG